MVDRYKAVFLPLDNRILSLYRGYVMDGRPLLNVRESDVYSIEDSIAYSNSYSKAEEIARLIVLGPLVPILIIILIVGAIFRKLDVVNRWLSSIIDGIFSYFFEKKTEKRVKKTKKKKYENAVEEDIPSFLFHCKLHYVRVYLYSYRELTKEEEEHINTLISAGLISSFQRIKVLSDLRPILLEGKISLHNSILVIADIEEQKEASLLGFYCGNGHQRNVELWKKRKLSSEGSNSEIEWNSRESLVELAGKVEYYLKAKNYTFLTSDCIIFLEDTYDDTLNAYIKKNFLSISKQLADKGFKFLYFPSFKNSEQELPKSILEFLRYRMPILYSLSDSEVVEIIGAVLKRLRPEDFYRMIMEELGLPYFKRPCLLRNISGNIIKSENKFTYKQIEYTTRKDLDDFFVWYINQIKNPDEFERVFYQLAPKPTLYDADWYFTEETKKDTEELKLRIDGFRAEGKFGVLAEALMYMLETIKDEKPEILKKVKPLIEQKKLLESKVILSSILVDKRYNIILPEFGNLEVKMHALPKTVYLFFLRYPDGVRFKELYKYKKELLEIYNKLTNKYDNEEIAKAIDDLVDMRNPSINQKCARIRESFRKLMDEGTARYYYVDGLNGEPKRIALPRNLIDIHC
jgi:hypothetical protein